MRQFWNVLGYTYLQMVRARSFRIGTVLMMVIAALLVAAPAAIQAIASRSGGAVAVVDGAPGALPLSAAGLAAEVSRSVRWEFAAPADEARLRAELKSGRGNLAGIVVIRPQPSGVPAVTAIAPALNPGFLAPFMAHAQAVYTDRALRRAGLSAAQQTAVLARLPLAQEPLQASHPERYWPVYMLEFLLYMFIMLYGMNMLTSVAAEKSSRVQEILIANVRPVALMYGKLAGTCLVGLTQYPLLLLAGLASHWLTAAAGAGAPPGFALLSGFSPGLLVLFAVFFVLGYFLFASLYAAAASLVSRVEDVQPMAQPITMLFVISFMVGVVALSMPDSRWVAICSFIPNFTPMVMFARLGMGSVPPLQVAAAVAILVAAVVLAGWASAKVYRLGVMLYGKRPGLREVARMLRAR